MIINETEEKYKAFLNRKDSRWEFGNSILYEMCEENPYHNNSDVVVGKIWLIGRSYAAAIERRKNVIYKVNDFYYEAVAPKMLEIGDELDSRIEQLRKSEGPASNSVKDILETHKFLMDAFYDLTGLEKRSLTSKYLHFHCPDLFFIYDSIARGAINKYVQRPDKAILKGIKCDMEYGDFVCRMIELQNYLYEKIGSYQMPRQIDSFLLR